MNIGELAKNDRGIFVGQIETVAVAMKLALNPNRSDNERAPAYDIYALAKSRAWVKVGALWTKETRESGEEFLQGHIDDPSMEQRLNIACFRRDDGSYAIAWSRPRNRGDRGLPVSNGPDGGDTNDADAGEPDLPFGGDDTSDKPRGRRRQQANELGESTSDVAA